MSLAPPTSNGQVQLTVQFVTKLPEHLKVPDTPLTVPGDSKRADLSKVINHLLQLDPPCPFDFVVQGKLLRTALHEHFMQERLSVEKSIEIEYIPVILPPKTKKTAMHDEWISTIDSCSATICAGSYDGMVKGWTTEALECQWSVAAHAHPVSCVRCVDVASMFLTASQDYCVKAWSCDEAVPSLLAVLEGHSDAVCSVDISPDGQRCCSVGWDAQILLWPCGASLREADDVSVNAAKRQKTQKAPATLPAKQISPLGTLEGHTGCISDVLWPREKRLFTSGWDHTLRRWDVTTGTMCEMLTAHRVIQCMTCPVNKASLIAFGSTDAVLRLWDTRIASKSLSLKLYRSHKGGIASVAWSPISDVHIASASHDGSVRIWDIRSTVPVASSAFHDDKCLAVHWCGDWMIVSGGADGALHLHDVNPSLT